MTNNPKNLLYFVVWCLLSLTMPLAGYGQSAYEQLQDAAGSQQGNVPNSGEPVCVGSNCPYAKKEAKESISSKTANPAIVGMLAKKSNVERVLTGKIQKYDQLIQKCDERIASTTAIIYKAQKMGKNEAKAVAQQALNTAQNAKKGYLEQKRKDEQQLRQVKEAMKALLGSLMNGSVPTDMRGVVSKFSGEVSLLRANSGSNATSLSNSSVPNPGYLAPGDEIQTGNNSMTELQILSGRGKMTMGENSKLRVEKDNGDAEVIRTLEGKFHFLVDKAEKFRADLETDLTALKETLAQLSVDSKDTYERFKKALTAKIQKKFETKTRVSVAIAVRATEYVVNENQDGSSEIVVIEGKVDVTELDGIKSVMVETGQVVSISSDGKLSGVRQIETSAMPKWWEESL